MRYRIMMSIVVDAAGERQAREYALKIKALLKGPLVKMGIEGEGVRLFDDGRPVVHQPRRETG